ncbi:MAG: FecR family protein [Bacteroidales bacterium]
MQSIIRKYLNHKANEEELVKLKSWLNESPKNREELIRLKNSYALSLIIGSEKSVTDEPSVNSEKSKQKTKRLFDQIRGSRWIQYAAVALIILSFQSLLRWRSDLNNESQYQEVSVGSGESAKVVLADGSVVWLNSNSVLKYPDSFNSRSRRVILNGEAFFQVNRDTKHPFVVEAGEISVKVLGTEFNVQSYSDELSLKVEVQSGKVQVTDFFGDKEGVILTANEKVEFIRVDRSMRLGKYDPNSESWRDGKYIFRNRSFGEIVRQLERIYGVKIQVHDPKLLEEIYYGEIDKSDPITKILDIISVSNHFEYRVSNKTIEITTSKIDKSL